MKKGFNLNDIRKRFNFNIGDEIIYKDSNDGYSERFNKIRIGKIVALYKYFYVVKDNTGYNTCLQYTDEVKGVKCD